MLQIACSQPLVIPLCGLLALCLWAQLLSVLYASTLLLLQVHQHCALKVLIATTMIASNVIMVTSNLRNATAAFTTKLDTLPPYLHLYQLHHCCGHHGHCRHCLHLSLSSSSKRIDPTSTFLNNDAFRVTYLPFRTAVIIVPFL